MDVETRSSDLQVTGAAAGAAKSRHHAGALLLQMFPILGFFVDAGLVSVPVSALELSFSSNMRCTWRLSSTNRFRSALRDGQCRKALRPDYF